MAASDRRSSSAISLAVSEGCWPDKRVVRMAWPGMKNADGRLCDGCAVSVSEH